MGKIITAISGLFLFAALGIIVSGCLEQFWPTPQVSPIIVKYANKDPNHFKLPLTTIGNLQNIKQETEKRYLDKETDLKAQLAVEQGTHELVKGELDIKIDTGLKQYGTIIGTIEKPGIVGTVLFSLLSAYGMKLYKDATLYTEKEVSEIKNGKDIT